MKKAHVVYAGRVQGVGFRWTCLRIAREFPVAGFVKNLPDGTVELVAEGDPEAVQSFLGKVAEVMKSNIVKTNVEWSESKGEFPSFDIAR